MNIKNILKLTYAVFVVSAISTGDVSSSIFAGLANKAKSAVGNAKNQLTTSVSGLKSQAKQTFESAKTAASDTIKSAQDQATASLSAVKEAGSNAISSIIPGVNKSEETSETNDEDLLLNEELDNADDILSELEEETPDTTLSKNDSEELLLDETPAEELLLDETPTDDSATSKTETGTEISDELALDDDSSSDFPEEVISKVDSLFPDIEKITSGKIIDLSHKNLSDEDIAYIAMIKIPSLSEKIEKITLKLSDNNLTNEGLKVLLDSLKSMPKLVSILDCSGNNIGDEGAMAIADSCQYLPLNHTIILSNCGISGMGILGVLSSILEINNSAYQYLDLSKNNIDPSYTPLIIEKLQTIKENSFEDGINLSETGVVISEGIKLPDNVIVGN